ncbi:TRAP transporter fused permease subunit [Grimontia kaedaensis]|uniref:TRAP transporter fused permease subunit n=1 Tax=Grimontia kaedaensis TaxID=2872157 RepID=A0ABY4WVT9_9GAMM|nr:TRAP transporter fused permease subunit [Grimontia kaedaensis]USH03500.1 TRAP transporter fused permease subunit [Grimontia kaedaensis]
MGTFGQSAGSQGCVEGGALPTLQSARMLLGQLCCVALAVFILWTTAFGKFPAQVQYGVALLLGLVAILAFKPFRLVGVKQFGLLDQLITLFFIVLAVSSGIYFLLNYEAIADMREGLPNNADLICYGAGTLVVLEGARRAEGWILISVVLVALVYLFFGQFFPSVLEHRPMDPEEVLEVSYSYQGIYGVALGAVVDVVYVFVILGVALRITGAGDFFNYIAMRFTRKYKSGPAQCAIFASAMFGSINGSAPANVSATGVLTIPMMKRAGFPSAFAGGVESTASCVGQIMPPIMGVGAFIMSEITGIAYTDIMIAACVPAFLFILSLVCAVAFEGGRIGLKERQDDQDLSFNQERLAQGLTLVVGFGSLVTMLLMGYSPTFCGLTATGIVLVMSNLFTATRMRLADAKAFLIDGGRDGLSVLVSCAAIGIIIGAVSTTGLGIKLNQVIVALGSHDLLLALVVAAICSIVLGMGLPTAASYLMVVFVAGPAIMKLGVPELQTHLFVFYYAVLSAITPPVALAIFAAAAICGAGPMQVAGKALKLSAVAFVIPVAWIYHPEINLQDLSSETALSTLSYVLALIIATVGVSAGLIGYFRSHLSWLERLVLVISAGLVISSVSEIIYLGTALLVGVLVFNFLRSPKHV